MAHPIPSDRTGAWTSGPWSASIPFGTDACPAIYTSDGLDPLDPHEVGLTEARANAHLMAAAPRLAEALQRIAGLTPSLANAPTAVDLYLTVRAIAESALAKAAGKDA